MTCVDKFSPAGEKTTTPQGFFHFPHLWKNLWRVWKTPVYNCAKLDYVNQTEQIFAFSARDTEIFPQGLEKLCGNLL
jgi:hypothetical protein